MKMNVTFLVVALSILFISVNCQTLGQALSKDSATISGQFSDLKSAFDAGISGMSTQVKDAVASAQNQLQNLFTGNTVQSNATKDALTQVKDAVSTAQNQLQNVLGNSTQVAAAKETLSNLGTKVGDTVKQVVNSKNFTSAFWNNDVLTKFHTSAKKLLDFNGTDAKYSAPKAEIANYMVNSQTQPNITDMINLARKHLSADEASKFFDQLASVAEQQKW